MEHSPSEANSHTAPFLWKPKVNYRV